MNKEEEQVEVLHRYTILYDEETEESEVNYVDYFDDDNTNETFLKIMENFKFLKENISLGVVNKTDRPTIIYPFDGDSSLIEKVKPGCHCTADINIDSINNVITAIYNPSSDKGPVTKNIKVYFKDGVDLEISTPTGIKTINPAKMFVTLSFNGRVQ